MTDRTLHAEWLLYLCEVFGVGLLNVTRFGYGIMGKDHAFKEQDIDFAALQLVAILTVLTYLCVTNPHVRQRSRTACMTGQDESRVDLMNVNLQLCVRSSQEGSLFV